MLYVPQTSKIINNNNKKVNFSAPYLTKNVNSSRCV